MSPKFKLLEDLVSQVSKNPEASNPAIPCNNFLGYGNPDARLLVIANSTNFFLKVADSNDAMKAENFQQWQQFFAKANGDPQYKLPNTPDFFTNPIKPLVNLPFNRGEGKSLNSLQRIMYHAKMVDEFQGPMKALDQAYYVDFAPIVTRNTAGKITNLTEVRKTIFSHPFFKSFDAVILAIGTELFDADYNWLFENFGFDNPDFYDKTEPNMITFKQTIAFFKGKGPLQGKLLVHTRRLSGGSSNDFFATFGEIMGKMMTE
jgi:hypothetical protein